MRIWTVSAAVVGFGLLLYGCQGPTSPPAGDSSSKKQVSTAQMPGKGPVPSNPPVATGPLTFSDPTPGVADDNNVGKFFLEPGSSFRGNLGIRQKIDWSLQILGIDLSELVGPGGSGTFVRFGVQNAAGGFNSLMIQVIKDHFGAGGHLLQSVEGFPFTVESSHGFNAGDVPGEFDLRLDFVQSSSGGTWQVTPQYRLPGGSWTTFFDGTWTSSASWNITKGLVFVDMGAKNGGVEIEQMMVTIADCSDPSGHGQFVRCVGDVLNDLQRAGDLSGKERGEIQRAAARAAIP